MIKERNSVRKGMKNGKDVSHSLHNTWHFGKPSLGHGMYIHGWQRCLEKCGSFWEKNSATRQLAESASLPVFQPPVCYLSLVLGFVFPRLTEEDTTSSSRIYVKILFQELAEFMGLPRLSDRLQDKTLAMYFEGIFPRDNPRHTRYLLTLCFCLSFHSYFALLSFQPRGS